MSSPFDFFDEIFVINLDRRKDKLEQVMGEFARIGIADRVKRAPAIEEKHGFDGCRLSHGMIASYAKKHGLKNVLVFEDDVIFQPVLTEKTDINEMLGASVAQLSAVPKWDMFYLGCNMKSPAENFGSIAKIGRAFATHAVCYNEEFFDRLTDYAFSDLSQHGTGWGSLRRIDVWMYHLQTANAIDCYSCVPMIALQRPGFSDVVGVHKDYNEQIISNQRKFLFTSQ